MPPRTQATFKSRALLGLNTNATIKLALYCRKGVCYFEVTFCGEQQTNLHVMSYCNTQRKGFFCDVLRILFVAATYIDI